MRTVFYPCVYAEDLEDGGYVVVVPGVNVNAQGETLEEALREAAEGLQDVVAHLTAAGEVVPPPEAELGHWFDNQRPAMLQAQMAEKVAA